MCLNSRELFDEAANDDADRHAHLVQEQRETKDENNEK